ERQSVPKRALLGPPGPVLLPDSPPDLAEPSGEPAAPAAPPGGRLDLEPFVHQRLGPDSRDLYKEALRELDRLLLPRVLEYTGGNQVRAALLLGGAPRTLRQKLRDLGLHAAHSVETDEDDLPYARPGPPPAPYPSPLATVPLLTDGRGLAAVQDKVGRRQHLVQAAGTAGSPGQGRQLGTGREGLHGPDDVGGAGEPPLAVLGQHPPQGAGEPLG